MKKRIISAMAILALLFGPVSIPQAPAQILLMDLEEEEENDRLNAKNSELELPNIPQLGITLDQYAPLGEGIVMLGCLGGAYLLAKRRKKDE